MCVFSLRLARARVGFTVMCVCVCVSWGLVRLRRCLERFGVCPFDMGLEGRSLACCWLKWAGDGKLPVAVCGRVVLTEQLGGCD